MKSQENDQKPTEGWVRGDGVKSLLKRRHEESLLVLVVSLTVVKVNGNGL